MPEVATTIRVEGHDGGWVQMDCTARDNDGITELSVPRMRGTWYINAAGMVANVGGNDWAIYTLHPEDCARICQAVRS